MKTVVAWLVVVALVTHGSSHLSFSETHSSAARSWSIGILTSSPSSAHIRLAVLISAAVAVVGVRSMCVCEHACVRVCVCAHARACGPAALAAHGLTSEKLFRFLLVPVVSTNKARQHLGVRVRVWVRV